jgi:hypothetical protein
MHLGVEDLKREVPEMSAKRKIFSCILGLLLAGLAPAHVLGQSVPFETIEKGEISSFRYGDPEFAGAAMVIKDQRTWIWFWRNHTEGILPAPPLPVVDFRVDMVLVAILGYQTSGGGPGIEITSIEDPFGSPPRPGKSIIVRVEENTQPGPLDLITNPFHIVKVRKAASVLFERRRAGNLCQDDSGCDEESFCLYPQGLCAPPGRCARRDVLCLAIVDPVCGCDGQTYSSACIAQQMGVSVLHRGACGEPDVPLDR